MNIDFSALQRPATKDEITAFRNKHNKKTISIGSILTFSIIGLFLLILLYVASWNNDLLTWLTTVLVVALTVGAVIVAAVVGRRMALQKVVKMSNFAEMNNLQLVMNQSKRFFTGSIFQHGSSRTFTAAYIFPDGKEIGNYSYATGSGRNRKVHTWGYVQLTLPRKLPHMLLDAKKNNILGRFSNLPMSLKGNQTMRLEGNFNEYFTLYVPKGYERDALYIFTPDVMSTLIDHGADYDIEVIDNHLNIYKSAHIQLDDTESLQAILSVVDKIGTEVIAQGDYYADERIGNRQLNEIQSTGKRLKSNTLLYSIIGIVAFLYVLISYIRTLFE